MSNHILNCNQDHITARVFHGLKSLFNLEDTLPPRYLEYAICKSFDLHHVGDGNFYADGYRDNIQVSIKTRMLNPDVLKTKTGRDFQTHPDKFLGPHQNVKQNKWTAGLEIVQRRQALEFDDVAATANKIGQATIDGFQSNVDESYKKYNTTQSFEIVGVHGYNHNKTAYIISLYWQEYQPLDAGQISWIREGYGVSGYATINNIKYKVCERVNGNAKREATCFKEFKNLNKYQHSVNIQVPIPDPWNFDQTAILTEINHLKGSTCVSTNILTE
jgi:hypothetical protein